MGEDPHRKTNVSHTMMTAAVGLPHKTLVLHDVRFWVLIGKRDWVKITDNVMVVLGSQSLLGTSSIKQLGSRYNVKFK